jgi:hypothetical protein
MMRIPQIMRGFMDQRIWEKLNELLLSSMHSKVVLQAVQASAPMFDMVANALGRNTNFPPSPTSESGADETRSEAMERYMSSRRSDVSDPSLWNYLHFGDEIPDESESNESNEA